jgi:hypothetical protein
LDLASGKSQVGVKLYLEGLHMLHHAARQAALFPLGLQATANLIRQLELHCSSSSCFVNLTDWNQKRDDPLNLNGHWHK